MGGVGGVAWDGWGQFGTLFEGVVDRLLIFLTFKTVRLRNLAIDRKAAHRQGLRVFEQAFEELAQCPIPLLFVCVRTALRDAQLMICANFADFARSQQFFEASVLFNQQGQIPQPVE
jgi:hypothetical protein